VGASGAGPGPNAVRPYTAEVPGVKEGEWHFHQLFVNGQRRQRARSPNTGFFHADGQFLAGNPARFKFHPGDIHAAWAEQGDVEVIGLEKWAEFRMTLKAVDPATHTATLSYIALPGEDVSQAQAVVPSLLQLIRMEGKVETSEFVHDIVLRGLT